MKNYLTIYYLVIFLNINIIMSYEWSKPSQKRFQVINFQSEQEIGFAKTLKNNEEKQDRIVLKKLLDEGVNNNKNHPCYKTCLNLLEKYPN